MTSKKAEKDADPKSFVKGEYRAGKLSSFATQDLLRLYEVMESVGSMSELQVENRRRIKHFNESLDLTQRPKGKLLNKSDFESYERKKLDPLFSWQMKPSTTDMTSLRDQLKNKP